MEPQTPKPIPRQRIPLFLIGLIAIALIIGLSIASLHHSTRNKAVLTTAPTSQAIIQITPTGFVPASLTIKKGTSVVWINSDNSPHLIASDPYPQDNATPNLKSTTLLPGDRYSFTPAGTNTITYHDDLHVTSHGTIVIQH